MPTLVSESRSLTHELLSAGEFLDWLSPGTKAELIDGDRFMHSPVSFAHARLTNFLERLVSLWIEETGIGGELHREQIAVRFDPRTVLMPDLAWYDGPTVSQFTSTFSPKPPQWIAEVLSPGTSARDTGAKFATYERSGVREYWILDPETLAHRFYRLNGDLFAEFAANADWIESEVLSGLRIDRRWLDPNNLPKVRDALALL